MAKSNFDGGWKRALDSYLRPFLELCFPDVAKQIDWRVRPVPMDKELERIARGAHTGKQFVDILVRVRRLDGAREYILAHVELQSQKDRKLPKRMYQYHHRLVDRYGRSVVTLVALGDLEKNWRPSKYVEELWGCSVRFTYPVVKLIDLDRAGSGAEP